MEKDAISAGVSKIGGLFTTADVRILICYLLSSVSDPVPATLLCETLHTEGIANAFEVSDSISFLTDSGHIKEVESEPASYVVTDSGRYVAETLKTKLSVIVKERAFTAVVKMLVKVRNAKETDFKITKEDNRTFLTCSAIDQGKPFMSIKLLLGDEDQAVFVKQKFLEKAPEIYSTVFDILTKSDKEN